MVLIHVWGNTEIQKLQRATYLEFGQQDGKPSMYHLVMTNSSPWKDPPFLIGKPSINGNFQ